MGHRDPSLYHLLQQNARKLGSSPAIIDPTTSISHEQFLSNIDRLAAGLSQRGIKKGSRLCILAQNSPAYFDLYGACAKLGAIAYPINWRLTSEEIGAVVALADPEMMVADAAHLPQLEGVDLGGIPLRYVIGSEPIESFQPLAQLYQDGPDEPDQHGGDDPFAIISTAAVAGVPRGAILTHANFHAAGAQLIESLGLTPEDRHIAALPLFHITGLGLSLAVLQAGGANVVTQGFNPAQVAEMIDTHRVTLMASFPPVLSMVLDAREASGAKWDSLRYVLGLDAPDTIQRLLSETKAQFWTGFGQSETSGVVTLGSVMDRPGSAGKPLPIVEVRCVDDRGEEVATSEVGEIVVRGPLVFAGYWHDPDATEFAARQGWHHTGDLGKFDQDGYLYYQGRKPEKDLIKSGGENIYPAEVEQVIRQMPAVSEVCVIGVPDEKWGEAVKAVVELVPGQSVSADEITAEVAGRIASYKKPRHIDFVESLPRLDGGEIDRQAVKANYG